MRESSSITLESDTRRTDQRKTKGPKAGQGTLVTKLKLTRRFLYILLLPEEPSVINKLFKGFFFWFRSLQSYRNAEKLCFILWNWITIETKGSHDYSQSETFAQLLGQRIVMTLILAGEIIFVTAKLNQYYCALCKNDNWEQINDLRLFRFEAAISVYITKIIFRFAFIFFWMLLICLNCDIPNELAIDRFRQS